MILKLLSIVALMDLVQSSPQIPTLNNIPGFGGQNGIADTVINTGKQIADNVVELIKNFNDFKTTFKKKYADKAEELLREGIFNVSLALINDHNKLFEQGKALFALGMNFFGDLTHDEYVKILGTKTLENIPGQKPRNKRQTRESDCKFPVEKDWRKDGAVTPVKHQGYPNACGSCWSFAAVASLESLFFIQSGQLNDFSEQQLVDCSSGSSGCHGGLVHKAFEYVMKKGIVTEDKYPYLARENCNGSCSKFQSDRKIAGYKFVNRFDETDLKDAICQFGPVTIAIDASSPKFKFYKKGIFASTDCNSTKVNHGMTAVGYGVEKKTKMPYWIIKNSWGTDWGEKGYARYRRDFNNLCGIAKQACYPVL